MIKERIYFLISSLIIPHAGNISSLSCLAPFLGLLSWCAIQIRRARRAVVSVAPATRKLHIWQDEAKGLALFSKVTKYILARVKGKNFCNSEYCAKCRKVKRKHGFCCTRVSAKHITALPLSVFSLSKSCHYQVGDTQKALLITPLSTVYLIVYLP